MIDHAFEHSLKADFQMLYPFCSAKSYKNYNVFKKHAETHINLEIEKRSETLNRLAMPNLPEIYAIHNICNDRCCLNLKFYDLRELMGHIKRHITVDQANNEIKE